MTERPPFTVRQILNLTWALTLNLSHDGKQNKLGDTIKTQMETIFQTYTTVSDSEKNIRARNAERMREKQFTENVVMAVGKTLRNLGLARDSHVVYLNDMTQRYLDEEEFLDDISSFSSFSAKGLVPKIIAFLGGGSAITTLKEVNVWLSGIQQDQIDRLENLIGNTADPTVKEELTRQLVQLSAPLMPSAGDILIFIVSGVAIMAVVTLVVKWWKRKHLESKRKKADEKAAAHWVKKVRASAVDCLFDLYRDLRFIMKNFYPDYTEPEFITAYDPITDLIDDIAAERVIAEEIINPTSIEYPGLVIIAKDQGKQEQKDQEPSPDAKTKSGESQPSGSVKEG